MTETEKAKPVKGIPFTSKLAIIALIIASTLAYSIVQKRKVDALTSTENNLILKSLPEFTFPPVKGNKSSVLVNNETIFGDKYDAVLIHFWGTWCAPCEAELPDFLNFVNKFQDKKVRAVLLAVQDDDKKINKFMKRFGDLPENVTVVHDKTGKSMLTFGTVKVPETYLFSKSGKNLNKYIGPQDWNHKSYNDRMNFYLSSLTGGQTPYKIESH
ncbi:MAG: TlpA family protein disulfide reductase [Bacteriovoracaceae bacterium]|nr:TlpA family protein disulfide reductase [Bacteriovoracaceae bacterium]